METKKVDSSLALRRLAALKKGGFKFEDVIVISFLVGDEKPLVEEIQVIKHELVVASEYFEGLLRSPLTLEGPIRLKHVEPQIFRLVVEFIHLSGHLVSEVNDLEQCVKLSAAADEFFLDGLGQLCTEKLEELITLDNVWTVFSQNYCNKYASAACEKLLSSKSDECLKEPAFFDIDENALSKFLNLNMQISSEMQLVRACLEFVKGKEDGRALFRRCILPHLRLLNLSADDLSELLPFLELNEKMLLSLNLWEKDPLQVKNEIIEATILCKEAGPRQLLQCPEKNLPVCKPEVNLQGSKILDLVPIDSIPGFSCKVQQNEFIQVGWKTTCENKNKSTFTLFVTPNCSIKITGFDIFCQIDENLFIRHKDMISRLKVGQAMSWKFDTFVKASVTTEGGISFPRTQILNFTELIDTWAHFESSFLVLKGQQCKIDVRFWNCCYVAKLLASDAVVSNPDLTCTVHHLEEECNLYGNNTIERCKEEFNIFKSICYEKL